MMVKSIVIISILYFNMLTFAQKAVDDFTGKWKAPKGAIIIITKSHTGFIGRTELEDAIVLKDVKFYNGKWTAVIINPKENQIANCELTLQEFKLKIIAKKGIFYKTLFWTKQ